MPTEQLIETSHDIIYNYGATPTVYSVRDGAWSNASMWNTGVVPAANAVVEINHELWFSADGNYPTTGVFLAVLVNDGATLANFALDGSFAGTKNFVLSARNFIELEEGAIDFRQAWRLRLGGGSYDTGDTGKWGNGGIFLGKVALRGRAKTNFAVRLAAEVAIGATTITLREPVVGWLAGDKVVVGGGPRAYTTGTPHLLASLMTIASVSADGLTITFTGAFTKAHQACQGCRSGNTVLGVLRDRRRILGSDRIIPWLHEDYVAGDTSLAKLDFMPHAYNFTRSALIDSLDASTNANRAHVMITDSAWGSVTNVAFENTGRTLSGTLHEVTNHIGRYPFHVHRLHNNSPGSTRTRVFGQEQNLRFIVQGITVADYVTTQGTNFVKWPITVHDSRNVLVQRCGAYNWGGSGITVEDNETYDNFFVENFVCTMTGNPQFGRDWGNEGDGYIGWTARNYYFGNIACNIAGVAYQMVEADPSVITGPESTIVLFEQNEDYHCSDGFKFWSVIGGAVKDHTSWSNDVAVMGLQYKTIDVTYDGIVARGQDNSIVTGVFTHGDYDTQGSHYRYLDIQNYVWSIEVPIKLGNTTFFRPYDYRGKRVIIEDCYFRARSYEIFVTMPQGGGTGGPESCVPREIVLRNIRYGPPVVGHIGKLIIDYNGTPGSHHLLNLQRVFVENHDNTGINYQVYSLNQTGSFVPTTGTGGANNIGSPQAGATNATLLAEWKWRMLGTTNEVQYWHHAGLTPTVEPDGVDPIRQAIDSDIEPNDGRYWKPVCLFGELAPTGTPDGTVSLGILGFVRTM